MLADINARLTRPRKDAVITHHPYPISGKEFNKENKIVRVHVHPSGNQPTFVRARFVEARIFLTDQTVRALPEDAVLREGEFSYVFVAPAENNSDEVEFERLRVNPGITDGGFTAVRLIDPCRMVCASSPREPISSMPKPGRSIRTRTPMN